MNYEADEVIEKLFESLKKIYQNKLEESVKGSKFHRRLCSFILHVINVTK